MSASLRGNMTLKRRTTYANRQQSESVDRLSSVHMPTFLCTINHFLLNFCHSFNFISVQIISLQRVLLAAWTSEQSMTAMNNGKLRGSLFSSVVSAWCLCSASGLLACLLERVMGRGGWDLDLLRAPCIPPPAPTPSERPSSPQNSQKSWTWITDDIPFFSESFFSVCVMIHWRVVGIWKVYLTLPLGITNKQTQKKTRRALIVT